MKIRIIQLFILSLFLWSGRAVSQEVPAYVFTSQTDVGLTPFKSGSDQSECWILTTTGFLESEILKSKNTTVEISDLAILHDYYLWKADLFIKSKGSFSFGPRGKPQDLLFLIEQNGFFPPDGFVTTGTTPEQFPGEMIAALKGTMSVVMKKNAGNFDQRWQDQFNATLHNYLGTPLDLVHSGNTKMNPLQYRDQFLPKPGDYITLTNIPGETEYREIILREPDNWNQNKSYNIPVHELTEVISQLLAKNHPVLWNGVLNQDMFYARQNVVVLPEKKLQASYNAPIPETKFNPEMRTALFGNFTQGSDSYLIISGKSVDQKNNVFFKAVNYCNKNIKGSNTMPVMLSQNVVMAKTISILVNRNFLPPQLVEKLRLAK